MAKACYFSL